MIRLGRAWATTLALASLATGMAAALPAHAMPAHAALAGTSAVCPVGWGSYAKTHSPDTTKPLTNVRIARHKCFDRMVIDVPGADRGSLGYLVRYVDRLYQEGSGRPIPVSGGAIVKIVIHAPAYDINTGEPTYSANPDDSLPGVNPDNYRTFRDAKFGGTFEGQTQFGLGVRARVPFRVQTLDGHLVVDVAHNWTGDSLSTR